MQFRQFNRRTGQLITALILFMPGMPLDPAPFNLMGLTKFQQAFPEIPIGDLLLFRIPPIDLRGVDVVALLPEASRVSEMTAAKLLLKTISFWGSAQGFNLKPQNGSQRQVEYE